MCTSMHPRTRGIRLTAAGLLCLLAVCRPAGSVAARVVLLDNRLDLSGSIRHSVMARDRIPDRESRFHDSRIDSSKTDLRLEGLLRLYQTPALRINVRAELHWWRESAPAFDDQLRDAIPSQARRRFLGPRDDDWIHEAYLDLAAPRWQLLLGKQIVVWGETDILRTADVVNPLDLRYSIPGIDTWEHLKSGLWMARFLFYTGLPGDLLIELIFNPGDFQPTRLPVEGSHWGPVPSDSSPAPHYIFGYTHWLLQKMHTDAPGWSLRDNYEWGVRLRGHAWNIDWTLFCFHTISDTPVARPRAFLRYSAAYAAGALRALARRRKTTPASPGSRVFDYRHFTVLGGTLQTHLAILRDTVWRLEWYVECNQHYNRALSAHMLRGLPRSIVTRDAFGAGLNYADRFRLPVITHRWCADKLLEISLTFFYEKILDYSRDLILDPSRGHRQGDSHTAALVWNLIQPVHYQNWVVVWAGTYYCNGMYLLLPMLMYSPGNHWRWAAGAALLGDRSDRARHPYGRKDTLFVRVGFEW